MLSSPWGKFPLCFPGNPAEAADDYGYRFSASSFVTNELIGPAVFFRMEIDPIRVTNYTETVPKTVSAIGPKGVDNLREIPWNPQSQWENMGKTSGKYGRITNNGGLELGDWTKWGSSNCQRIFKSFKVL